MIEYKVKVYDNKTEWFNQEGQRHREDGPAIEYANGYKSWYLNGIEVNEDQVMNSAKELTMAQLEELLGYKIKVIK